MNLPLRKGTRDRKETWKDSVERLYEIWLKTKMSLPVSGWQLVKRVLWVYRSDSFKNKEEEEEEEEEKKNRNKNKKRWSAFNCFFAR